MRVYQCAMATVALMFGVSGISQAAATDVACTGCVGSGDLANGSVTSIKIKDGTIAAADLAPALLARISALEAKVKKLEGGAYSQATLKGTYKCLEMSVGGSWDVEKTVGDMVYGAGYGYVAADGAGTVSVISGGDEAELIFNGFSVQNGLSIQDSHHLWKEAGSFSYTVSAAGKVVFDLATPNESLTGWLGRNGDMLIAQYIDNDTTDRDRFRTLQTCVRTAP